MPTFGPRWTRPKSKRRLKRPRQAAANLPAAQLSGKPTQQTDVFPQAAQTILALQRSAGNNAVRRLLDGQQSYGDSDQTPAKGLSAKPDKGSWAADPVLNAIRAQPRGSNKELLARNDSDREDIKAATRLVQQYLKWWGALALDTILVPSGVTGNFGIFTADAVRDFQDYVGVGSDGIIGPVTLKHMDDQLANSPEQAHHFPTGLLPPADDSDYRPPGWDTPGKHRSRSWRIRFKGMKITAIGKGSERKYSKSRTAIVSATFVMTDADLPTPHVWMAYRFQGVGELEGTDPQIDDVEDEKLVYSVKMAGAESAAYYTFANNAHNLLGFAGDASLWMDTASKVTLKIDFEFPRPLKYRIDLPDKLTDYVILSMNTKGKLVPKKGPRWI